ncbi:HEAT repeat [Carpediemonas membranifera]|uniref:HEAT repeat n=1 Tax=Carpediemonas membranifera TaxID=201153 RepID=A0A8J6APK4_9EUKA|nr:HEAT repeat [Carpediemonas membranifera]|eukprot:KAG9389593.1 HEAT repeat [Carpediemonas membranifera]
MVSFPTSKESPRGHRGSYSPSSPRIPVKLVKGALQELVSGDSALQLRGIRELHSICDYIGPKRTQDELMPLLADLVDPADDDEAVQKEICHQLKGMAQRVLDPASLFSVVKKLLEGDTFAVRRAAVETLEAITVDMAPADADRSLFDLYSELTAGPFYNQLSSAAFITPIVYERCSTKTNDIVTLFDSLQDENQLEVTRKSAVEAAGPLTIQVHNKKNADHARAIVDWFKSFLSDTSDTIRMHAVLGLPALTTLIIGHGAHEDVEWTIDTVTLAAADPSWRVRRCISTAMAGIAAPLAQHNTETSSKLVPIFADLLNDSEAEVRLEAVRRTMELAQNVPEAEITRHLVPALSQLKTDALQPVKVAVAQTVCRLATRLTPSNITQHLKPVVFRILSDPDSEVRLAVLALLETAIPRVGAHDPSFRALLTSAIGACDGMPKTGLMADSLWRTRETLARLLPALVRSFSVKDAEANTPADSSERFITTLAGCELTLLADSVFEVRQAAADAAVDLVDLMGRPWVASALVPTIQRMAKNQTYLIRISAMHTLVAVAEAVTSTDPSFGPTLVDIAGGVANDRVPNVRINAAKALGVVGQCVDRLNTVQVKAVLTGMGNDSDKDVRDAAEDATQAIC